MPIRENYKGKWVNTVWDKTDAVAIAGGASLGSTGGYISNPTAERTGIGALVGSLAGLATSSLRTRDLLFYSPLKTYGRKGFPNQEDWTLPEYKSFAFEADVDFQEPVPRRTAKIHYKFGIKYLCNVSIRGVGWKGRGFKRRQLGGVTYEGNLPEDFHSYHVRIVAFPIYTATDYPMIWNTVYLDGERMISNVDAHPRKVPYTGNYLFLGFYAGGEAKKVEFKNVRVWEPSWDEIDYPWPAKVKEPHPKVELSKTTEH